MDIQEAINYSSKLEGDTARLDVECLLSFVLQKDRTYLRTWPDYKLSEAEMVQFTDLFERRLSGEPVAYLIGSREFWNLSLKVSPATLIPRPETELIVELALDLVVDKTAEVLDLGTGTGAIALSLAAERPSWQLLGVDVSDAAVKLAQENAELNNLSRVHFSQSDWFQSVPKNRFNLIVSNPPYIDGNDPHLQEGDVRFEPASALVAKDKGLADIKVIVSDSREYLENGGFLMIEHGYDQGELARHIFEINGYQNIATHKDLGGNERVTLGVWGQ